MKITLIIILATYAAISQYIISGMSNDLDKMFAVNKNILESCTKE